VFGVTFDFIVAQSIFSHAGPDLIETGLKNFKQVLQPNGLILATFMPNTKQPEATMMGWLYPGCLAYSHDSIMRFADSANLAAMRIPWHHPRQDWYVMAHDASQLPSEEDAQRHLTGYVLRDTTLQYREV
jgi:cyclopropane fatty-acyl-phospholipid synthase-like methyltransferase